MITPQLTLCLNRRKKLKAYWGGVYLPASEVVMTQNVSGRAEITLLFAAPHVRLTMDDPADELGNVYDY